MNSEFAEGLKRNWYLGAAAMGCAVLGVAMGLRGGGIESTSEAPSQIGIMSTDASASASMNTAAGTPWENLQTRDQQIKSSVQDYRHKIHDEVPTEDTDMDMMRLANLYYSNMQEYNEAATYYEMLLKQYPDFEMASIVFQNLAECYKRLGETSNERNTYRRMMHHFPEGTNENDYARDQLGL